MERFHVSKAGDVAHILAHGFDPASTADGVLWLAPSLDAARVWWTSFELELVRPSLWRIDVEDVRILPRGFHSEVTSEPLGPERLTLLHEGPEPDWLALDPSAHGQSSWHKEHPNEFWDRMRMLHGDVGPGR